MFSRSPLTPMSTKAVAYSIYQLIWYLDHGGEQLDEEKLNLNQQVFPLLPCVVQPLTCASRHSSFGLQHSDPGAGVIRRSSYPGQHLGLAPLL